ncbi:MAG: 6,7-dimethyl-8-ribityllumazine synthase [Ignavibacteriae bacterium]|nr:6,7-dimethyl-8-ribityllumazine synthase [Ignavibacteriota bacterium]
MKIIQGNADTAGAKIGIIASRFNPEITDNLITGALTALKTKGVSEDDITLIKVPGAFEIPAVLEKICKDNNKYVFDGILTIGCVIKGETAHFEYISSAVSGNICRISSKYGIPTGFCVLTCYNDAQAEERSRVNPATAENNKGYESALAVLEMINLLKKI